MSGLHRVRAEGADGTGTAGLRFRLTRRALPWVRSGWYRLAWHRSFPGKAALARRLTDWEERTGRGDVPTSRTQWDTQHAEGGWQFLAGLGEVAHYAVVVGYGSFFCPAGSVLDVGCGTGVLHERWRAVGYSRYVGLDVSEVAVRGLQEQAAPNTEFLAVAAEDYQPADRFDVVVFNESITYLDQPERQFARYLSHVSAQGVAIVSCHVQSARAQAIQRALCARHRLLDETVVRQGANSWRIVVIAPARGRAS